jgi:hypothetical protein
MSLADVVAVLFLISSGRHWMESWAELLML